MKYIYTILLFIASLSIQAACDFEIVIEDCKIKITCTDTGELTAQINACNAQVTPSFGNSFQITNGTTSWVGNMNNVINYDDFATLSTDIMMAADECCKVDIGPIVIEGPIEVDTDCLDSISICGPVEIEYPDVDTIPGVQKVCLTKNCIVKEYYKKELIGGDTKDVCFLGQICEGSNEVTDFVTGQVIQGAKLQCERITEERFAFCFLVNATGEEETGFLVVQSDGSRFVESVDGTTYPLDNTIITWE